MQVAGATRAIHGKMSLRLMDAATFTWSAAHSAHLVGTFSIAGGGSKALSAELTQVRITVTGSDTFDAGSVNIAYR